MHYGDNPYESAVSTLAGELLIKPMQGGTTDQAVVAKAREDLNACFARLEKEVGNNDYLLGSAFTLADIPFVSWAMLFPNLKVEVPSAKVNAWLARNPRIHLHFTPTSCSWLNLVECFFSIITRQAIRRGTFSSVKDLVAAIRRFIAGWNERCEPFVWTKPADEILSEAKRKTTSRTRH